MLEAQGAEGFCLLPFSVENVTYDLSEDIESPLSMSADGTDLGRLATTSDSKIRVQKLRKCCKAGEKNSKREFNRKNYKIKSLDLKN